MNERFFINYGNGTVTIGATSMKQLGKRPSLMIQRGNCAHKVASFQSVDAAQEFTDALGELCGFTKGDTDEVAP